MNILGLHFGHDASVAVIKDNKLAVCLERERRVRIKHSIGLTLEDIEAALEDSECSLEDIDYCAITNTQNIEYIFIEPEVFSFRILLDDGSLPKEHWAHHITQDDLEARSYKRVLSLVESGIDHPYVHRLTDDFKKARIEHTVGGIEDFIQIPEWQDGRGLNDIGELIVNEPFSEFMSQSMQLPISVTIKNRKIPGWMLSHHFAHAATAYYLSGFDSSAILTQDGSLPRGGYWNGMCYYGKGRKLYPVMPHYLNCGHLYEGVAVLLGLGLEAGPGKMMGLAPYGQSRFFDEQFVGNVVDAQQRNNLEETEGFPNWEPTQFDILQNSWIRHCAKIAKDLAYDLSPLGDTNKILAPINVDIAASTQKWLEETMLKCVDVMYETYLKRGWNVDNLCLSGGVALNCPMNSRIYRESLFDNVYIPPAVHDGGLSIGAALAILHNTLGVERNFDYGYDTNKTAFLGLRRGESEIALNLEAKKKEFNINKFSDISRVAAQRLARNEVIVLYSGRSEIGPRALGHRSILANPAYLENWKKVNELKFREQWRPLAPAVLEEKVNEWFEGISEVSPFMLFTASVKGDGIPAVTHVDNSARVQTVSDENSIFYSIISEFEKLTGLPVVMNTSFNGPGEPVIETVDQAVDFFSKRPFDALYVDTYEITKIA